VRGLSTVVITVLLIVVGVILAVAAYAGSSGIIGGATSAPVLQTQASIIKAEYKNGTGSIYLSIVNSGPGSIQIVGFVLVDKTGHDYVIAFTSSGTGIVEYGTTTSSSTSWTGSTGVGIGTGTSMLIHAAPPGDIGVSSSYFMAVPSGGQLSVTLLFNGVGGCKIINAFDVGASYRVVLQPVMGVDVLFSIQCVST